MSLIKAHELVSKAIKEHEENRQRVEKALNNALLKLEIGKGQNLVENLYIPGLRQSDERFVKPLMKEAGYEGIVFTVTRDPLRSDDVHISFRFAGF